MRYRYLSIFLLFITAVPPAIAQNNTSPYSIIGIGDIETSTFDRSSGMGNAGISLSSSRFLYQSNPASVSRLDDHFFTAEVSARYKGVSYYGDAAGSTTNNSADLQVRKFVMAVKIRPWWGISFGLMPFSTSSYSFYAPKSLQGTNQIYQAYYQGSGGLNEYFLTNAFNINKHLSVGVQTSYLAGSFLQTESLDSVTLGTSLNTTRNIYMAKFYAKAGLQFQTKLSKKWKLGIGATVSNKAALNTNYYLTVTTTGGEIVVNNENIQTTNFTIPVMYGGGASLTYNDKLTFAGDYQHQNWGSLGYTGLGYALVNSSRISGGVQYSKNGGYQNNFFERSNLQFGLYYGNSYLDINGYQIKDYGFSVGAGFSGKDGRMGCQFNMQVGQTGTTQNGLIREDYIQLGVTLTYRDLWYTKLKKYF